jgi:hypothetical protein
MRNFVHKWRILFALGLAWSLYLEFLENDPLDFFRGHPEQLLFVAIMAVLIGVAMPFIAKIRRYILFRMGLLVSVIASIYASVAAIQTWSFHIEIEALVDSPLHVALPIEFTLSAVLLTVVAAAMWSGSFYFLRGSGLLPLAVTTEERTDGFLCDLLPNQTILLLG